MKNKRYVEGSICDAYLIEETTHFASFYFEDHVQSKRTRIGRNLNDGGIDPNLPTTLSIFIRPGRPMGAKSQRYLDSKERFTAHQYILLNCEDVQPILRLYETGLRQYNPGATTEDIVQEVERSFASWFRDYVYNPANNVCNQALIDLACGPLMQATTYNGYVVNGFKFQTEQHCIRKSTNNFGVSIKGTSLSHGESLFFGTLKEIVEVEYPNIPLKKVVLFNCEWFDPTPNTGTKLNFDSGLIEVHYRKRFEPHSAHRRIIECIQKAYPQAIKSFKAAPQYLKDVWFNEFKKDYRWDPLEENTIRRIFEKKGAKLLTDHLREVRVRLADENKTKPHWIADDVLDDLVRIWESEDFKKLSKKTRDTMNELRQTQTEASDAELWLEATGGVKRGGYVYGFGSDTQHYFSEASKKSKSQAGASSSNAALMADI
nr:putative transposase En/Spm [Ipomoea batatas]